MFSVEERWGDHKVFVNLQDVSPVASMSELKKMIVLHARSTMMLHAGPIPDTTRPRTATAREFILYPGR